MRGRNLAKSYFLQNCVIENMHKTQTKNCCWFYSSAETEKNGLFYKTEVDERRTVVISLTIFVVRKYSTET